MASATGEELEFDDDVILCSVELQEQYEGWVLCPHPDCESRVALTEWDEHSLSHATPDPSGSLDYTRDVELATALQRREEKLIAAQDSDFLIALSLQQQENESHPAVPSTGSSPTQPSNTTSSSSKMKGYVSSSTLPFPGPTNSTNHKPTSNIHTFSDYKPDKTGGRGTGGRGRGRGTGGRGGERGRGTGGRGRGTEGRGTEGRGGYMAQTLSRLEQEVYRGKISSGEYHSRKQDLLESIHTGRDDLASCSEGIVQSLRYSYQLFTPPWRFYLSLDTPHFSYSLGDRGWGCGYRNIQMVVGSLLRSEKYRDTMNRTFQGQIPTVPRLQELLEGAWRAGYDREGARDLGFKVRDTRTWIGATEAAVLLRSCGVKAEIVDFVRPTGPNGTHLRLVEWVEEFYRGSVDRPPLYLQHSGHSRTVIGCGLYQCNRYLTILDPMLGPERLRRGVRLRERELVWMLSRISNHFKKQQYQIVFVDGLIEEHQRETYKVISSFKRFD